METIAGHILPPAIPVRRLYFRIRGVGTVAAAALRDRTKTMALLLNDTRTQRIARPAGPRGDDGQGGLRQAALAVVQAALPAESVMQGTDFGPLLDSVKQLATAMRVIDRPEPLLSAVDQVVAARPLTPESVGRRLLDHETATLTKVDRLAQVVERDRVLILAVSACQPHVVVVHEEAEARVPISEGSKIHAMIDRALEVHHLTGGDGGYLLLAEDGRDLGVFSLARDEGIHAGDRLTLQRRD